MANSGAIFGGYDQAALDREYDNRSKVAHFPAIADRWIAWGKEARDSMSCRLDLSYGPDDRQKLDMFPVATPGAPILAFMHGGYWRSWDKSFGHFIAPFYVAAGINFVSIGYRLCPDAGLGDIVEDVRAALKWVHVNAADLGADPRRLFVAGHSAGGHLAALMCGPRGMAPGIIQGGCSISGLHDLEPIRLSYLNETLGLDQEAARALSPVVLARSLAPGGAAALPPLLLTAGGEEGPEYARQRDDLAAALRAARQPVSIVENFGGDHFTACEAFRDPSHPLSDAMLRLILAPGF
jgi:arylformamidase